MVMVEKPKAKPRVKKNDLNYVLYLLLAWGGREGGVRKTHGLSKVFNAHLGKRVIQLCVQQLFESSLCEVLLQFSLVERERLLFHVGRGGSLWFTLGRGMDQYSAPFCRVWLWLCLCFWLWLF